MEAEYEPKDSMKKSQLSCGTKYRVFRCSQLLMCYTKSNIYCTQLLMPTILLLHNMQKLVT